MEWGGIRPMSLVGEHPIYCEYVEGLPRYLSAFAEPQHYQRYTPEDQAVWRFIMRQLTEFFKLRAPEAYQEGLQRAAITVERIPRIEEMIQSLSEIGWGAICVNGFIPPAVFMEYNANKILPISADMRILEHLLYTPAPDIVHEAAGHAPIVADPEYTDFLQKVGEYGAKALSNQYDQRVYEAIRKLSMVKEHPQSSPEDIRVAGEELSRVVTERNQHPESEAALISRFHWWTVEYGLLQRADGTRIYGAGLLSSLGESRTCLDQQVAKIKLSIECIEVDYDITTEQPQLFYVESSKELFPVLEQLAEGMAFRRGGGDSVDKAIACGCQATVVYDSGLQVSGVWSRCFKDQEGRAIYIATVGGTSLAYWGRELTGHGEGYHTQGFSSPVGRLRGCDKPLAELDYRGLEAMGIVCGRSSRLEFSSGVVVEGMLREIMSRNGLNILLTFVECRVEGPRGEVWFEPEWGTYDMAVGEELSSIFGGPADKSNYSFINHKSDYCNLRVDYPPSKRQLFALYQRVRRMREQGQGQVAELQQIYGEVKQLAPDNWLVPLEIAELLHCCSDGKREDLLAEVRGYLGQLQGGGARLHN